VSSTDSRGPGAGAGVAVHATETKPQVAFWNDPGKRGLLFQIVLFGLIAFLIYAAIDNAGTNLAKQKITRGFGFWNNTAGFDIGQFLIPYEVTSTFGRAFWVGLLNTLLVAGLGIILATFLGFIIGVARLSKNWLVQKLATLYVEVIRNTPLLLQLLFWYNAVLKALPEVRDSLEFKVPLLNLWPHLIMIFLPLALMAGGWMMFRRAGGAGFTPMRTGGLIFGLIGLALAIFDMLSLRVETMGLGTYVNNRGLFVPKPIAEPGLDFVFWTLLAGIIVLFLYRRWAKQRQERTGQQAPVALVGLGLVVILPLLLFFLLGRPLSLGMPEVGRFNIRGGVQILPEFVALLTGLVIYTAAFIAEVVRAGIQAVSKGQTEAAYALGLRPGPTLDLVVIPQAMRVIIPPLTSQYLNLTKNSSLAVAIGYFDLVNVNNTIMGLTNQSVEVIAVTMAVYLMISLTTSLVMNAYNARKALVER
jgi:general L-amino acid transport system permease protein